MELGSQPAAFPAERMRRASGTVKAVSSTNASQNRAKPCVAMSGISSSIRSLM
jgi:hypothetical protein